jgi:hypothetical protein
MRALIDSLRQRLQAEVRFPPALRGTLGRFAGDRRGTTATMFALSIIPMMAAVGGAIDYGRGQLVATRVKNAADFAVLTALVNRTDKSKDRTTILGETFSASVAQIPEAIVSDISKHVDESTGIPVVRLTYTLKVKAMVAPLVGIDEWTMAKARVVEGVGTNEAGSGYTDIFVVADNSASMGIAADEYNRDKLVSVVMGMTARNRVIEAAQAGKTGEPYRADRCAFACHTANNDPHSYAPNEEAPNFFTLSKTKKGGKGINDYSDLKGKDYDTVSKYVDNSKFRNLLDVARENNVYLRWDALKDSLVTFTSELAKQKDADKFFRYHLYKMNDGIHLVAKDLKISVDPLTHLNSVPIESWASRLDRIATTMPGIVGTSGSGNSTSDRKKVVLLITDGQRTVFDGSMWDRNHFYPFNPAHCDPLKSKGVTVAVIHTRYIEMRKNLDIDENGEGWWGYMSTVDAYPKENPWMTKYPGKDPMAEGLRECASAGMFFSADSPEQIKTSLKLIAGQIQKPLRLSK